MWSPKPTKIFKCIENNFPMGWLASDSSWSKMLLNTDSIYPDYPSLSQSVSRDFSEHNRMERFSDLTKGIVIGAQIHSMEG